METVFPTPQPEATETLREPMARIAAFVRDELDPIVREHGITHETSIDRGLLRRIWKRSRELGIYGMTLPEKMGGAGLTVLEHVLLKEFVYSSGSPLAPHVLGELSGPPRIGALVRQATPEQIERLIQPVARGERAICFAITEENAGSDAGALQTRAVRDGDHFVLNGRKRYISGAPFADLAVVIASTSDDPAVRETSAFVVELDSPGARVEWGYRTLAGQASTGDIVLEDCRVPAANLVGEPGRGLQLALGRITVNRLLHCPTMVALGTLAFRDARDYAMKRSQFGQPIAGFQAIQHMLANMAMELSAARALTLAVARELDAGVDPRARASMAKLYCSEVAHRVADRAVQVLGGAGIVQGSRVEWLFRMTRMFSILTGTSEIQRNTIARELLSPRTAA